jgi:hypothetical protein
MGDQEPQENECASPQTCPYHRVMHDKVRAVEIEGEKYLNAEDLARHIDNYLSLQVARTAASIEDLPEEAQAMPMALVRSLLGWSTMTAQTIESIGKRDILPLSDAQGTLISPESAKVPETFPEDWATPTEE